MVPVMPAVPRPGALPRAVRRRALRRPAPAARWRAERAARRRDEQLPEAFERLAASVRAGRSLGAALAEVAAGAPAPLGDELAAAGRALAGGAAVDAAVAAWRAAAAPTPDLELAATALSLSARAGGEVGRACDRVAATLRERRELRAEARALATQARASAAVLTVAPRGFALLVSAVEPGVLGFLLTTAPGLVCLAIGVALDAAGALWMARIVERAA
jgi:tight adherence protein B